MAEALYKTQEPYKNVDLGMEGFGSESVIPQLVPLDRPLHPGYSQAAALLHLAAGLQVEKLLRRERAYLEPVRRGDSCGA